MQTYTFICDWVNLDTTPYKRFVVVAAGETVEKASLKAAETVLAHYPEIAETETPATFWDDYAGGQQIAILYGDHAYCLVDQTEYDVFRAPTAE